MKNNSDRVESEELPAQEKIVKLRLPHNWGNTIEILGDVIAHRPTESGEEK
ncbi:MAG: hypothetical protein ACQEXV_22380 [Bacillota bacterium]